MHVIAAKAVAFHEALQPEFRSYAAQIVANARTLADELRNRGLRLITGGTDTHLVLADVTPRGLTGKQAEQALDRAGITVNKNLIPFDQRPPLDPSGLRIGTPALTTRGMKEPEMRRIGHWIDQVLSAPDDDRLLLRIRSEVRELCQQFPAPALPIPV
jgi:glycine hydroxymethyltransferase